MKQNMMFLLIIGALSVVDTTFSGAAESLYIQPFQAKIHAKPSMASEVIATVDSGFQFVPTGSEGKWLKLVFKGKPGFVPSVQASKTPPFFKSSSQTGDTALKLGARARTSSSVAVVAGMKGLTYEDRARVAGSEQSDFGALAKVDALIISPDELKLFLLEGGKR
jgi:hypothetical protein